LSGRAIRASVLGLVIATALVLVFAIGGSSAQQATQSQGSSRSVSIRMAEFNFGGTTQLPSGGQYTFHFWDAGSFPHNFTVIQGPVKFASQTLQRNAKQDLNVNLRPGAYLAICTVRDGGHMRNGMVHVFTVGTQDAQTGQWR
jgi:plastocyanin